MTARVRMLGTWVDALTIPGLVDAIAARVADGSGGAVANHNLHSLALWRRGDFPPGWYEDAALIHADGMLVVWIARLAGQALHRTHRTAYIDWLPLLLDRADRERWRVYHLGGEAGHQQLLRDTVAARWPGIDFACSDGFFSDGAAAAAAVAAHRPHVLLAGMGMPRQERWLQAHRAAFPQAVLLPCGAAAKFLTGTERIPPRWLGVLGLEWLHRLAADPRRLWHRYLVEPFALLGPVLAHILRCRLGPRRGD